MGQGGAAAHARHHLDAPAGRAERVAAGALLLVLAVAFVVHGFGFITAPFGDSHDGRNAAVWGTGSRAIRTDGFIGSRGGARSVVRGQASSYADHPPLILWETAAAESVFGEHEAVTRAPAWAGSLALIVLLYLLLRACQLRPVAAAAGVVMGLGTPMFFLYGTMLDTPMTSLPFAAALLWVWQRGRSGRPVRGPVIGALAAVCVLASWEGLLVAGALAAGAIIGRVRRAAWHPGDRAVAAGAAAGAALVVLWIAWSGAARSVAEQFLHRSGSDGHGATASQFIHMQLAYGRELFPVATVLVAGGGLVMAWRRRSTRVAAALPAVLCVAYAIGFRDGAVNHDYWNYWLALPLAVGGAAAADCLVALVTSGTLTPLLRRTVALAATALPLLAIAGATSAHSYAELAIIRGRQAGTVVRAARWPAAQPVAYYQGAIGEPATWISYYSHRSAENADALAVPAGARVLVALAGPSGGYALGCSTASAGCR